MPNSTPNSPNELFRNLPPEQALDALLGTQLQLIKLMQKNACSHSDDAVIEVNAGELKSVLQSFRFIVESFQELIQTLRRFTNS